MANLRTTYLGLPLEHPVVAAPSPLSRTLDGIRRLEDGGAAAIVLFSLFAEQVITAAEPAVNGTDAVANGHAPSWRPPQLSSGPDAYLELIRRAKESVDIPVIASLNGITDASWTKFARDAQQAGADAVELNIFYIPADLAVSARHVEQRYVDIVLAVRSAVRIPVAVKVCPFFSAMGEMARRLVVAGADGLVLFNRFYQPDIDIERLQLLPTLELSQPAEARLPLLWIALLRGRMPVDLAASTGVRDAEQVIKFLLAGADVVMTASALIREGPGHIARLRRGLDGWLDRRGHASLSEVRGLLAHHDIADPEAYERLNYIRVLEDGATTAAGAVPSGST